MKKILTALLISSALYVQAQVPSVISCWQVNPGTDTGFAGILTNAQAVQYSDSDVYISTTDIASWIPVGYNWPNNPWFPQDMNYTFKITRYPRPNTGALVSTPNGHIGLWKNGVSVYNPKDTKSYNDSSVWFQNAFYFEHIQHETFDPCWGHPNQSHEYHTHQSPACLYDDTDSTHHSPLIGYAFDGYPIYGAYGYASPNTVGPVKRMVSSYRLRAIATRDTLPDGTVLAPAYQGPPLDSIPIGSYMEDFEYVSGLGDLDEHNGRTCVTPEYPSGTYAYFVTLGADLIPAFPYVLGTTFYGVTHGNDGNMGPNSGYVTVPAGVTTYVPDSTTGISQIDMSLSLRVFPNPASEQLNFRLTTNNIYQQFTGTIYDQSGKLIETGNVIPDKEYAYNTGSLSSGIYLLKVESKAQSYTSKFIIVK